MKLALLVALVFALACGPIPGGSLEGDAAAVPSDWKAALGADHALCEIESRPADPHSIQLECFVVDGKLYEPDDKADKPEPKKDDGKKPDPTGDEHQEEVIQ